MKFKCPLAFVVVGGTMNWDTMGTGIFLVFAVASAESILDMIFAPIAILGVLGLLMIISGLTDSTGKEIRSIKKKLSKIERSSDTNSGDLSELYMMVVKTQNVLGYKFRMFVEVCLIQFENLTEEWQNHFMMSAEFSSLYEKAFTNAGLLTREEKEKFVQWMNKALESLDQDIIREFSFSDDFRLYKEIVELYTD